MIESAGGVIALDETLELSHDPMFDSDSRRSSTAPVVPGDYTARVWAIAADGSQTQQRDYAFTVAETQPAAVTMTQNPDDENAMDLVYENTTGEVTQATMRYKMCSGPLVFAHRTFGSRHRSARRPRQIDRHASHSSRDDRLGDGHAVL